MIEIISSHEDHIPLLADRLLEKDRICRMMPLWNVRDIMKHNLRISVESHTAFLDGEAACMYGYYLPSLMDSRVMPWMMAADTVKNARVAFYRRARKYISDLSIKYGCLTGSVDDQFYDSIVWIKWLGFEIKSDYSFDMVKP